MNEELQKALATILSKTTSAAEAGVEFLQRELPDVIRQLLMWHAVKSAVIFFALLAFAGAATWLAVRSVRAARDLEEKSKYYADGTGYWLGCVCCGSAAIGSLMIAIGNLQWLQILIAP